MQVFSFWWIAQLSFVFVLYQLLLEMSRSTIVMSHMIEARKIGNSRKRYQEAVDSQRRGPQSSKFTKKGSTDQKVWDPLP